MNRAEYEEMLLEGGSVVLANTDYVESFWTTIAIACLTRLGIFPIKKAAIRKTVIALLDLCVSSNQRCLRKVCNLVLPAR